MIDFTQVKERKNKKVGKGIKQIFSVSFNNDTALWMIAFLMVAMLSGIIFFCMLPKKCAVMLKDAV